MKGKQSLKDKVLSRVLCIFGIHRYLNVLNNVIVRCEDCNKVRVIRD